MMSVYVDGIHWKQHSYNYSFNNINLRWIFFISHFSFLFFSFLFHFLGFLSLILHKTQTKTTISPHGNVRKIRTETEKKTLRQKKRLHVTPVSFKNLCACCVCVSLVLYLLRYYFGAHICY